MSEEIVMLCGGPGSGKGAIAFQKQYQSYRYISQLYPVWTYDAIIGEFKRALRNEDSIIIDVPHTAAKRQVFIDLCGNKSIKCIYLNTPVEDAERNVLEKMYYLYGKYFFHIKDIKKMGPNPFPNIYPPTVFYDSYDAFEPPTLFEGFSEIIEQPFVRVLDQRYNNKALFLDYDQTLRDSTGQYDYPCHPDEIVILPNRREKLAEYVQKGYILVGVSNQSGIEKGNLSHDMAITCFETTNSQLGCKIDYAFCPHQSNPIVCYCRKPHVGNGVYLIQKHKICTANSIFVGDQQSDKQFADNLNIPFQFANEFFK